MAPPTAKRKLDSANARVSPPPVKRKVQSGTTKNAVANFFTPTSQKPKDKTTWSERAPRDGQPTSLLVGRYEPDAKEDPRTKRRRVAAFDLDSTLITTASGKKHGDDPGDWKWWDNGVPAILKELYSEGYRLVILSNQGGLVLHPDPKTKPPKSLKDRVVNFKQKCSAVLSHLDLPLTVYAATGRDIFRKPRTGMWDELCKDYALDDVDFENSIFVGDAGGRTAALAAGDSRAKAVAKDFSCSDRNFAHNVGIRYLAPEEFFLQQKPRDFTRDFNLADFPHGDSDTNVLFSKNNKLDVILFCGFPGAGKSTFYTNILEPLGYERINQDILKTRPKCLEVATQSLKSGRSVAIDNTNPDPDTRAVWVELADKLKVPIRCVWLKTTRAVAEHNNAVRALNKSMNPEDRGELPQMAFEGFRSRFRKPELKEGFQDIIEVDFRFRGTENEYAIWGRYWL